VTRALNGHKSNVLSLEFANLGLLSGSMDTNIKVRQEGVCPYSCLFLGSI